MTGPIAALGGAIAGSINAGTLTLFAYRLLRKRAPLSYTIREGWDTLADELVKRVGRRMLSPAQPR